MTGITIGSYEIAEKIGSGGVGDVFRATDPLLDRSVAIKFVRPELADRAEVVSRFHAEARALAQLTHPNIALLYCLLREGSHLGMVMELVEGRTFAQILRTSGRLAPERALPLIHQALEGIGHAHQAGIVHRDLKPSNLMLASSGCVKVMDFGIARFVGTDRATRHGHMIGTVQYMSPEQVRGGETDARSDIYALGVVLYELLTGSVPFDSENDYELCRAQLEDEPESLRVRAPEVTEALDAVVLRALAKDPTQRFAGVRELRDALERAVPRATESRFTADRDALPTREIAPALEAEVLDAEPLDLPPTRILLAPGAQSAPIARAPRWKPALAAVAALLLLGAIGLLTRTDSEVRAEPEVAAAVAAVSPPESAPVASEPTTQLVSTPAAETTSLPMRGGSGWVIRRR